MPAYNKTFDLDPDDVDIIESALHETVRTLSVSNLDNQSCETTQERIRQTKELLGRLHNQKVFYRPKKDVYVGG